MTPARHTHDHANLEHIFGSEKHGALLPPLFLPCVPLSWQRRCCCMRAWEWWEICGEGMGGQEGETGGGRPQEESSRRKRMRRGRNGVHEEKSHGPGRRGLASRDPPSLAEPTRSPWGAILVSPLKTVSCIQTKSDFVPKGQLFSRPCTGWKSPCSAATIQDLPDGHGWRRKRCHKYNHAQRHEISMLLHNPYMCHVTCM